MQISPYPLSWPIAAYPRTSFHQRQEARFAVSFAVARDHLLDEIKRLGATEVVLSSNIPLKRDGIPYANFKEPDDPGVAVYFIWKNNCYVLACDRWTKAKDNFRAIGLHISALRGMDRWGVGTVEQAFSGYQALPHAQSPVDYGNASLI